MGLYGESVAALIRQERPHMTMYGETKEELFECMAGVYLHARGYDLPEDAATIEDLERKKEKGYGALINDGKLIGFIYEKTP